MKSSYLERKSFYMWCVKHIQTLIKNNNLKQAWDMSSMINEIVEEHNQEKKWWQAPLNPVVVPEVNND